MMESGSAYDARRQQPLGERAVNIFCLYDVEDASFFRELKKRFFPWERQRQVIWLEISPGDAIEHIISRHLQGADLILLLFSADFFQESRLYDAMLAALEERVQRQVSVVPILARASAWKELACGELPALPENDQPITLWADRDEAYDHIFQRLLRLLPRLLPHVSEHSPASQTDVMRATKALRARELPPDYVHRSWPFAELKRSLLEREGNQTTAITTALRGMGGFGKSTLALALCHDPEVQAAFPDGVFWLELGEQPPGTITLLNRLLPVLGDTYREAITVEEAKTRWQQALQDKHCLLVIDDVWQMAHLQPLLESGSHSARLVTTRNDHVLPKDAKRIVVDAMSPQEAMTMLTRGLPDEVQQDSYQTVLTELAAQLGYWPFLLGVASGFLTTQLRHGYTLDQVFTAIIQTYQVQGNIARLPEANRAIDFLAMVDICLQASFRQLEQLGATRYQPGDRYQELAVFPEDIDIPLPVLKRFWRATGGLDASETEDLCMQLYSLSLLLTCDLDKGIIRLHDVTRTYLIQRIEEQLPTFQASFLDAQSHALGITRWANLSPDETYLSRFLVWHLCQATSWKELETTLTDLLFLAGKALYSISDLEADLWLASTLSPAEAAPALSSLHRRIVNISHLLRQVKTFAEMGGILLSHLGWDSPFIIQRLSWEQKLPRPFLTAWFPLPSNASSALVRTANRSGKVSPDSRFIVSSKKHMLTLWDIATGEQHVSLHVDASCYTVSPDGRFIVSGSEGGILKVWDVSTETERFILKGHSALIRSCAVSPDGRFIVSASDDTTIKVWDAYTGTEQFTLKGHSALIRSCVVSPDGRFIVSASDDTTIKVWDAYTGTEQFTLKGHRGEVNQCVVSPDSRFIVSNSHHIYFGIDYHTLKVWDIVRRKQCLSKHIDFFDMTGRCAVSADSRFIIAGSYDGTVKIRDIFTGKERFSLKGHTDIVSSCAVSADGRFIVSASEDGTVKIWDWDVTIEKKHYTPRKHQSPIRSCAMSVDGRFIVSGSEDGTLKVRDATTGEERRSFSGTYGIKNPIYSCGISADGRFIISCSSIWGGFEVWDVSTGKKCSFPTNSTSALTYAMSTDGCSILSGFKDGTYQLWDITTGKESLILSSHNDSSKSCAVSYDPDGRFIVSGFENGTLKIWNTMTGTEQFTLTGHKDHISRCTVSCDGHSIVSASWDGTLKVWDTTTGVEHFALSDHTARVEDCAVSPDSRFIVSVSRDKTLKIWNLLTGVCLLTFPTDGALLGCAFHPDGEHLVVCGTQGMYFLRLVTRESR